MSTVATARPSVKPIRRPAVLPARIVRTATTLWPGLLRIDDVAYYYQFRWRQQHVGFVLQEHGESQTFVCSVPLDPLKCRGFCDRCPRSRGGCRHVKALQPIVAAWIGRR